MVAKTLKKLLLLVVMPMMMRMIRMTIALTTMMIMIGSVRPAETGSMFRRLLSCNSASDVKAWEKRPY